MIPLKQQFKKKITYWLAAFLVLAFAFRIMYANYRAQLEIRENSLQRAEDSFKGACKNMTSFLLERQDDIRGLALDRTIMTFFENRALGMSMKYGLAVSLNNIKKQINSFQQYYTIEGKTIFARLQLRDSHGKVLVDKLSPKFNAIPDKTKKNTTIPDHPHMAHDTEHPDYLMISSPCIFKKSIVGHLTGWIPYQILFDQFLRTSKSRDVERFYLITDKKTNSIIVPYFQEGSRSTLPVKLQQAVFNHEINFVCGKTGKNYLIFVNQPDPVPFEIVKLLLKQNVFGTYNPKILFAGMVTICALLFVSIFFLIRASIKQQINAVKLSETIERQRHIEEKNRELEKANEIILTSRREAVAEREQLNITLRSIGDGVITTDFNNKIVLINGVAEKLTGWSQKEAWGQDMATVFNIINGKTGEPCKSPLEQVFNTGRITTLENDTILISKDGTHVNVADSAAPILDPEGATIGIILVFRDITKEKRTEAELLKIKKLESVGVLAGGIAHDFNNILTIILGNINLARAYLTSNDKATALLNKAEKASHRAQGLTQQLLTFSKGGDPVRETTDIKEVIIDSAHFVLLGSKVACNFAIDDDLWLVDIDTGQMSQVIQNITLNARHAMPRGGEITIKCSNVNDISMETDLDIQGKKYIKITIQDNGDGISQQHLDKIFDPYFSTRQEGSGLGLAITHSIINKHDGNIFVNSEPGQGTLFTIYLPASDKSVNSIKTFKKIKRIKTDSRAKILVMDDEELILNLAEKMLGYLGHEVLKASDGREAIELYKKQLYSKKPIDVIIMDLTIPGGIGGREAIIEILKIDPRAKAVVSSGYSNDKVMADYQRYGFKAAIAKPYKLAELQGIIDSILQ